MSRDRDAAIERLREHLPVVFDESGVIAAYVFGSHARGDDHARSDVDLGVVVSGARSIERVLRLARQVREHAGIEVDLVVLNDLSLRFLRRILHDGILIYSKDESARVEFETRMRKLSQDFAIHADRMDRELLAATAAGRR